MRTAALVLQLLCHCCDTVGNSHHGFDSDLNLAADLRLLSTIDSTAVASNTGAGLRYVVQSRAYPSSPNDLVTTMRGGGVAVWRWNEDRRSDEAALLRVRTVVLPGVPTEGQDSVGDLLVLVALNPHSRERMGQLLLCAPL